MRGITNNFWNGFFLDSKPKFEENANEDTFFYPKHPYPSNPYFTPAHKTKINPVGIDDGLT